MRLIGDGANLLGPTEKGLFDRMIRCYDNKDFEKGLKYAKTILSNPNYAKHGETISLKGLFMTCLGDEEGYKTCKQGLAYNLKSHLSWQVLGLVERDRRNYSAAMKCFLNAHTHSPRNVQVLRDLAGIQIHQGDYDGHLETKTKMYQLDPNENLNIIGYSYAHYLVKNYEKALEILNSLFKDGERFYESLNENEKNNMLLFEIMLLLEMKQYDKVINMCTEKVSLLLDKNRVLNYLAICYHNLNNIHEEAECYLRLVLLCPHNETYIEKYVSLVVEKMSKAENEGDSLENAKNCAKNNNDDGSSSAEQDCGTRREIYSQILAHVPDSIILKQKMLYVTTDEEFEVAFQEYFQESLKKRIPHAIKLLKTIYTNDEDVKIDFIEEELIEQSEILAGDKESLKWTYFYLASHYSIYQNYKHAFEFLDKCLEIDPNMLDALLLYAKLFKSINNFTCANEIMRKVAHNHLADKFINSLTGKYIMYTNDSELADEFLRRFSRVNVSVNGYMHSVQCLWYRIYKAFTFYRKKMFYEALHHVLIGESHFSQFFHDKFDFHNYCIRNTLLAPYSELCKHEDYIRSSKFSWNLIKIAVFTLIELYDNLKYPNREEKLDSDTKNDTLSSKEKKLMKFKALKEKQKSNKHNNSVDQNGNNSADQNGNIKNALKKLKCSCPYGSKNSDCVELIKTDYSTEKGYKLISDLFEKLIHYLNSYFGEKFTAQLLLFEMYMRLGKPLLIMRSYSKMVAIDSGHYKTFIYQDKMLRYFVENYESFGIKVRGVIESILKFDLSEKHLYEGYINNCLINYLRVYESCLWNLVSYIIVAKSHNVTALVSATFKTICSIMKREVDLFTYREMSKFRKFVIKHYPEGQTEIDKIIHLNYPIMFQKQFY